MYNFLLTAAKERLLIEIRDSLREYPCYQDLPVYNRFPFKERIQEGVVLKNTTASRMPLSADNFQGSVYAHVALAKYKNLPSKSLDWVREDRLNLALKVVEDYSYQFNVINNIIVVDNQMVKGQTDISFAETISDVVVVVNGDKTIPQAVSGENKRIVLTHAPPVGSTVTVEYWIRNLAPSGIYKINILEGGNSQLQQYQFNVESVLDRNETLVDGATGSESTLQLSSYPTYPDSLILRENNILMTPDVDYVINEDTGAITLLNNLLVNSVVTCEYRVEGLTTGPYDIPNANYAHYTAIPGVVLAFGDCVSSCDKHFVIVTDTREHISDEYSGKWEMSFSLDVYAKDSLEIEKLADIVSTHLLVYKKSELDSEGIYLVDVAFDGETEQLYDDLTGQVFYMGSISYSFMTEWIMHKPVLTSIKGFRFDEVTLSIRPFLSTTRIDYERIK